MSVLTGYSQLANGTSLDTLAQLAAIPAAERSDGMALVVIRENANNQPYWYHYKGDATPVNESPYKIAPNDNMGCWFRGVPQVLTLAVANTLYATINHTHSEYETAGAAASSMAAHLAQSDPHSQYLTQSESDALYAAINHAHSVFNISNNGFVPASGGNSSKFLRGDGTWQDAAGGLAFGQIANNGGTVQFSAGSVNDILRFATSGSASIAFDPTNKLITIGATGTTYSAGTGLNLAGTTFSVASGVLDGNSISVTAVDTAPTSLGPANLIQWFGGITNRIKAILGSTNWWDAPATTLGATATHLINTSNPHSTTATQVGAIATTEKATANGVATLDATTRIPIEQIPQALIGAVVYQGAWNPATNTPPLISSVGTKGHYYVCSTSGSTSLDGISDWSTSDVVIFNGLIWQRVDARDAVTSVNGQVGAVNLTAANVGAEPTITTLPVNKGGTGLGSIAAGNILYTVGANTLATTVLSEFIRGFLDDANEATARATLGANDAANLTTGILAALRLPLATSTTRGAIATFETGIWTGVLEGTTTAGTHTYSVQKGSYLKFDVLCVAPFYINVSSKDAAMAGNSRIGGLPFTAKNEPNFFQSILFSQFSNVTFSSGYTFLGGRVDPNTTKVLLIQGGSGVPGAVINASNVANAAFIGCVLYVTN